MSPPLPTALPSQVEDQFVYEVTLRLWRRGLRPVNHPFADVERWIDEALATTHPVMGAEIDPATLTPILYRDPAWRIPATRVHDFAVLAHFINQVDAPPAELPISPTASQWVGWANAWALRVNLPSAHLATRRT